MEGGHALIHSVITPKRRVTSILRSWLLSAIQAKVLEAHPSDGHHRRARTGRIQIVRCGRLEYSGLIETQCGSCTETARIPIRYLYESTMSVSQSGTAPSMRVNHVRVFGDKSRQGHVDK